MRRHLRSLMTPVIVICVLLFTAAVTQQAQLRRPGQRQATLGQAQAADATPDAAPPQQSSTDLAQGTRQGRRGRRGRRGDAGASSSDTAATQGSKVSVVRRLNQARQSAAQIKTIRSLPLLRGVVAVRGNSIRPLAGSSLWLLSNGSILILGGGTVEPFYEKFEKDIGNGTMVWACMCLGVDPNEKDDGCEFDGPPQSLQCVKKGGMDCTCKLQDFLVTEGGGVIGFEGPPSN